MAQNEGDSTPWLLEAEVPPASLWFSEVSVRWSLLQPLTPQANPSLEFPAWLGHHAYDARSAVENRRIKVAAARSGVLRAAPLRFGIGGRTGLLRAPGPRALGRGEPGDGAGRGVRRSLRNLEGGQGAVRGAQACFGPEGIHRLGYGPVLRGWRFSPIL